MALASESAIRAKIVETIQSAAPQARVWPRVRRPQQGTAADYARIYADEDRKVHLWMVRRVQRQVEVDDHDVIVKAVQVYSLIGFYSLIDDEDDALASEAIFQAEIEAIAAAFESGPVFALDGVFHRGLTMPSDFSDKFLGDILCHEAICRLVVDVEDC